MKLVILDKDDNEISSEELINQDYIKTNKVDTVSHISYDNLLESLEQEVSIFLPYKDDFIIKYLSPLLLEEHNIDSNNTVLGCSFSKTIRISSNLTIFKMFKEVYKTGESLTYKLLYYDDDYLVKYHVYTVLKDSNKIFLLINDLSQEKKGEIRENELFNNAVYGMITIKNGIFLRVNKAYSDITGYPIDEIIGESIYFNNPVFPYSRKEIKKRIRKLEDGKLFRDEFEYSFYHKTNGKKLFLTLSSYPVLYEGEKSIQCIIQDITEKKEIEKEILQLYDHLLDIQNVSGFALSYTEDNIFKWTPEIYEIIERGPREVDKYINLAYEFVVPEDKHILNEAYDTLSPENPSFNITFRIKTAKDNIKHVNYFIKITYENNTIIKRTTLMQDVTEQRLKELEFMNLSEERGVLLKEVHDRVKNNLQIILSLIDLDKRFKDYPKDLLNDIKSRIAAMALVHRIIYRAETFSTVELKSYIKSLVNSLLELYESENIMFTSNIEEIDGELDLVIPLGLIINELVKNSIKYAFPDGEGIINIDFYTQKNNEIILIIEDNGIGLPDDFDIDYNTGLGMMVVKNLLSQINGSISLEDKKGTSFKMIFTDDL